MKIQVLVFAFGSESSNAAAESNGGVVVSQAAGLTGNTSSSYAAS
jgi:hypothetical protein